ncbi:aminotransferase class I/II-fold pyridoxal phosphate-dependent enzyme [Candidatus Saccharibacteria bacterium]|nr:aminotransferase class I/II-fold pyridoxal phosphate-dependent enzyme [Candidatus Saccharibacteria bacterium]NIV71809.1 aminotransferase class I/II-fold pyridoxal phosphate-dependent enzyme [Calditrichia bacterium]NIW78779.1 aminotransferase class I/II-fold pyridoxal phosphate-dependent enzyme [Calditrichia bacterium]
MGKSTKSIHAGNLEHPIYGEVSVPIFQSSTFSFPNADEGARRFSGDTDGFIYTRMGNPTIKALEDNLSALENGFAGMATATGMAAITTVLLTVLDQKSHIVSTACVYGPTRVVLEKEFSRFGVESTFVETSDADNIANAIKSHTEVVFVETPANPTILITDLGAAADIAHQHNALLVVDNTFASPYLQRPFEHGADIVVHSLTKYLNGHSDVVGGMIVTRNENLFQRIRPVLNLFGGTMDPHQAWLVLRGVRTLSLRVEKSQNNAAKLAQFLIEHPNVTWVNYPGLPDHPQHHIAKKQMDGFGSMISFGVKNGIEGGKIVMNNVKLLTLAVSLGGVESLIEHPASMTHASVPRKEREESGILDELVRLSVGCEDFEDLRDDLDRALNKIPS